MEENMNANVEGDTPVEGAPAPDATPAATPAPEGDAPAEATEEKTTDEASA